MNARLATHDSHSLNIKWMTTACTLIISVTQLEGLVPVDIVPHRNITLLELAWLGLAWLDCIVLVVHFMCFPFVCEHSVTLTSILFIQKRGERQHHPKGCEAKQHHRKGVRGGRRHHSGGGEGSTTTQKVGKVAPQMRREGARRWEGKQHCPEEEPRQHHPKGARGESTATQKEEEGKAAPQRERQNHMEGLEGSTTHTETRRKLHHPKGESGETTTQKVKGGSGTTRKREVWVVPVCVGHISSIVALIPTF